MKESCDKWKNPRQASEDEKKIIWVPKLQIFKEPQQLIIKGRRGVYWMHKQVQDTQSELQKF